MSVEDFWSKEIKSDFNRHRRIYRDVLLYSYLLETDCNGNRKGFLDLDELRNRVHVSDDGFNLCLTTFEELKFLDSSGIATPSAFKEIQRLVERDYAADTPIYGKMQNLTPRVYLDTMFSSGTPKLIHDIYVLIAEVFQSAMEVDTDLDQNLLVITSRDGYEPWGIWFKVIPSHDIIQNTNIVIEPMETIIKYYRQANTNTSMHYILVCSNLGGDVIHHIFETDGLSVMVGTSMIKLLRHLQEMARSHSKKDITDCFSHFFEFGQREYTISVGDGLDRVKANLP